MGGEKLKIVHLHPALKKKIKSKNLDLARYAYAQLSAIERYVFDQEISGEARQIGQEDQFILEEGNFLSTDTVTQIQSGEVDLSDIFKAAAEKISKEKAAKREN